MDVLLGLTLRNMDRSIKMDMEAAQDNKSFLLTNRQRFDPSLWLAAVVHDSHDAIVSKTLDGIITSWNPSAERLFGFTAEEMLGRSITTIIPADRLDEENRILAKLRRGERIEQFETVRRTKSGELIDIEITVSPVRDRNGEIIGASKIARDISEAKRLTEQQKLIIREMNHRIKNLFALTQGLVALSSRNSASAKELARDITERLAALAKAHQLVLPDLRGDGTGPGSVSLTEMLKVTLAPYDAGSVRIDVQGQDCRIGGRAMTSIALLLHELATNAAKYGALATPEGRLEVTISPDDKNLVMHWAEFCSAGHPADLGDAGFGTELERAAIRGLGAELERSWRDDGLSIRMSFPLSRLN